MDRWGGEMLGRIGSRALVHRGEGMEGGYGVGVGEMEVQDMCVDTWYLTL